jgi:hypothetical protein
VIGIFTDALKLVWRMSVVFSGMAFFLVFGERQIKLRRELDTEFGLREEGRGKEGEEERRGGG